MSGTPAREGVMMGATMEFDPEVLAWVARVAEAVRSAGDLKLNYGEYYVTRVQFGFDGSDTSDFALELMADYDMMMVRFGMGGAE